MKNISLNSWIGMVTLLANIIFFSITVSKLSHIELYASYAQYSTTQKVEIVNDAPIPVQLQKIADRDLKWDENIWRIPFLGLAKIPGSLNPPPRDPPTSGDSPSSVDPFIGGGIFVGKPPPQQ